MFQRLKTKSKGLLFYNEGDESTGLVGSGLCICFKAHGLRSMGYLFLNEQKEKIQPAHRSGMGFKAIKQNKNGPQFYNESDECTRTVFSLHLSETIILAELFSFWYSPAD